jgi:hypothetical protein
MPGRALAVGSLLLAAAIAGSSAATASRPALTITSTPTAQSLETKVVVSRIDARTHRPLAALRLATATFTVTVSNPGDIDLADVAVGASAVPGCNRSLGTLAAGASVVYTCRAANVGRDFTNRLTASGKVANGARTLAAVTTARVSVKAPKRRSRIPHLFPHAVAATG